MDVLHFNQLGLITLNGEPWKRARRIISPAFSASKVKQVYTCIYYIIIIYNIFSVLKYQCQ